MDLSEREREEYPPYLQLLMLLFYAVLGILVFSIIAVIVIISLYGLPALTNPAVMSGSEPRYLPAMQLLLMASSLGLFLTPALLLAITEGRKPQHFYGFKAPTLKILGLVVLIMIVSMPFMEWSMLTNQKLILPDFLKEVERWIREKENQTLQATINLLKMASIKGLLINLFLIAVLPAVSEELLFRGGVQRTLGRIFKNPHVSIWVAAAIFSAIHVQFYGFLPRMLLGAGFGYLYYWSGSLWYAILGHFLNNAYAVCAAYYMQKNNMSLAEMDTTANFTWYVYLISFILMIAAFGLFKKQTEKQITE